MPFSFTCPHCGARTEVDDQFAGQTGPCATCGKQITAVPTADRRGEGGSLMASGGAAAVIAVVIILGLLCSGAAAFLFAVG